MELSESLEGRMISEFWPVPGISQEKSWLMEERVGLLTCAIEVASCYRCIKGVAGMVRLCAQMARLDESYFVLDQYLLATG